MDNTTYMAVDQYGTTYHDLGPYPRRELLQRLSRKHSNRMFIDKKDGQCVQIGWIIATLWLTVYKVNRMEKT